MNFAETLDNHFFLCQEIHQLLLEENRIMQNTQRPPDAGFLEIKRSLLPRIENSFQALRALGPKVPTEALLHKQSIERAQQKLLTMLLLDRENEKLLLKFSMSGSTRPAAQRPSAQAVRRAYASSMV